MTPEPRSREELEHEVQSLRIALGAIVMMTARPLKENRPGVLNRQLDGILAVAAGALSGEEVPLPAQGRRKR